MSAEITKVGIISCSGEAIPAGTISRLAARRVLELLRPDVTVTLCLPLFLAGNEGERNFARAHPTITIDGCEKQCAKWGTAKHSGPVSASLVVPEILQAGTSGCHCSTLGLTEEDTKAVWTVAERIAAEVDTVLATAAPRDAVEAASSTCQCGCSSPLSGGNLTIRGKMFSIPGLPLIFEQYAAVGIPDEAGNGTALLEAVKIYHAIVPEDEAEYRTALLEAYQEFKGGSKSAK